MANSGSNFLDDNPNDTGSGHHNPRYDQDYLNVHLESQALKPMSPYDSVNPNAEWYQSTEPDLPPHDPDSKLTYRPLLDGSSKRWIRVLKLEPGWAYLKLRCSLIHINIDDADHVPYEAISYTWGKYYDNTRHDGSTRDQLSDRIICDGTWTRVTRSLFHALQMFRLTDRARFLWADALCINQEDDQEKSWQVGLMRHIYARAFHVLIWIGYRDPKVVKRTMDLVCQIVNQKRTEEERKGVEAKWYDEQSILELPGTPSVIADSPSSVYEEDAPDEPVPEMVFDVETMRPLVDLFEARYFSRVWVFQEVALSPGATMCWSNARIRFEWVALVADLISRHHLAEFMWLEVAYYGMSNCSMMYSAWRGEFAKRRFLDLLVKTHALQSFDPRDKIYGVIGIKTMDSDPANGHPFIDSDYSRTPGDLYREVARRMLLQQQDLQCLQLVAHVDGQKLHDGTSWAHDFSSTQLQNFDLKENNAHAGTLASVKDASQSKSCSQSGCLTFSGIHADTVASIIDPAFPANSRWRSSGKVQCLQRVIHALLLEHADIDIAMCLTGGDTLTDPTSHTAAMHAFSTWHPETETTGESQDPLIAPPRPSSSSATRTTYKFFQMSSVATQGNRVFFRTRNGLLGLGPRCVEEGDTVAVLFGGGVPFVLRAAKESETGEPLMGHWRLVGACYIRGLMEGQAVERWKESGGDAVGFHVI